MLKPLGADSNSRILQTDLNKSESIEILQKHSDLEMEHAQPTSKSYTNAMMMENALSGQAWATKLQSQIPPNKTDISSKEPVGQSSSTDLAKSAKGSEVKDLQEDLNKWRASNGLTPISVDGSFGDETEAAVRQFQRSTGLIENGVAGVDTRIRMEMETSSEFKALDADSQNKLRELSREWQNDPIKRQWLMPMVSDGGLSNLAKPQRDDVLKAFAEKPSETVRLSGVYGSDNFQRLNEAQQNRILNMAIKNSSNEKYVNDLSHLVAEGSFRDISADQRSKTLDDFEIDHSPMATIPEYHQLDDDTKKKLGELYLEWKDDPVKSQHLPLLVADGALMNLSKPNRDMVVQAFAEKPEIWMKMVGVYGNDTFQSMDPSQQARVLNMGIRHSDNEVYIKNLQNFMAEVDFRKLSNEQMTEALNEFQQAHLDGA